MRVSPSTGSLQAVIAARCAIARSEPSAHAEKHGVVDVGGGHLVAINGDHALPPTTTQRAKTVTSPSSASMADHAQP
jgi:hypothetical protein